MLYKPVHLFEVDQCELLKTSKLEKKVKKFLWFYKIFSNKKCSQEILVKKSEIVKV